MITKIITQQHSQFCNFSQSVHETKMIEGLKMQKAMSMLSSFNLHTLTSVCSFAILFNFQAQLFIGG